MTNTQIIKDVPHDAWNINWRNEEDYKRCNIFGWKEENYACVISFILKNNELTCGVYDMKSYYFEDSWVEDIHKRYTPTYFDSTTIENEDDIPKWIVKQLHIVGNEISFETHLKTKVMQHFVWEDFKSIFANTVNNILSKTSNASKELLDEAIAISNYKNWEKAVPLKDGVRFYNKAPRLLKALVEYYDNKVKYDTQTIIGIGNGYIK